MAVTDALSVAMKMLGLGADVYAGLFDGTKYNGGTQRTTKQTTGLCTREQRDKIFDAARASGYTEAQLKTYMKNKHGKERTPELTKEEASELIKDLMEANLPMEDLPTEIKNFEDLCRSCSGLWGMTKSEVLKELGISSETQIGDVGDAFLQIKAVKQ